MDTFLFEKINAFAGHWSVLDWLAVFSAKYLPYILVLIFAYLYFKKREKIFVISFISALFSRFIIVEIIRFFYNRPRPFEVMPVIQLIQHEPGASFPSGHAVFFFALSAGVYSCSKKAGIWFFCASLLMGLARVFAGIHYPADIIAGAIVGIAVFELARWLQAKLWQLKQ